MSNNCSLKYDISNFKTSSLLHRKQGKDKRMERDVHRNTQDTQLSALPLSPEGSATVCVGTVSEFTFPFSNVSFSVCCSCQLRPKRCIAGEKETGWLKGR